MERTRRDRSACPRILGGPIVAPSGEQADPLAVLPGDQPIAVVLDFMDTSRAAGRLLGGVPAVEPRKRGKVDGIPQGRAPALPPHLLGLVCPETWRP
jgi:hypothetical protein